MRRLTVAVGAVALLTPLVRSVGAQDLDRGKELYDRWCAGCHGETGAGDGPGAEYMFPRPRDFTGAVYQIRTTASGDLPTDADLRKVIDEGMPGSAMPGWADKFSDAERDDIIAYVKSFSRFFDGADPEPYQLTSPPRVTEETLAEGRRLFVEELECLKCHGDQGRGDGTSAPDQTDDWDFPIRVADLSENWNFNGGGTVEDIYLRLRTGLDGTPMPSQSDVVESEIITDEQLWMTAQYVRSLSPEDPPTVRDVIRAALVEGALPADVADQAWDQVESFYVPVVGQIIVSPRWFTPAVDGIWVQAVHDGEQLALRVTWNDPSASPDDAWQVYFDRIKQFYAEIDEPLIEQQGPDLLVVQFPETITDGNALPFFLAGDTRRPVYQIRWTSSPERVDEGRAQGLGSFAPSSTGEAGSQSAFEAGRWQVMLTRPMVPAEDAGPALTTGEPIPIAFMVADGTNAEDEMRGAVSAWYSIYLDVPTPSTVFVIPVVTAVLTVGLGLVVIRQAQRNNGLNS